MFEFIREFWAFVKVRKKFWLLPLLTVMILLGILIVLTEGSAVAPFIYAIFKASNYPDYVRGGKNQAYVCFSWYFLNG